MNQHTQRGEEPPMPLHTSSTDNRAVVRRLFSRRNPFLFSSTDNPIGVLLGTAASPAAFWYLLKPAFANAFTFALLAAIAGGALSSSLQGIQFGLVFGATFGTYYFFLHRALLRRFGESLFSVLLHAFSGGVAGIGASIVTKLIHPYRIYKEVIDAIYGTGIGMNTEPERAFYIIMGGAFFGGFLGVAQCLLSTARSISLAAEDHSSQESSSEEPPKKDSLPSAEREGSLSTPPPNRRYAPSHRGRSGFFAGFSHN